jgi:hypothetical protein
MVRLKIEISVNASHTFRVLGEDMNVILLVVGLIVVLVVAVFLLFISWQLIMGMEFVRS